MTKQSTMTEAESVAEMNRLNRSTITLQSVVIVILAVSALGYALALGVAIGFTLWIWVSVALFAAIGVLNVATIIRNLLLPGKIARLAAEQA